MAAAGLVLGGAPAQNGTQEPQGHQGAEHERVRLLAATLGSDSWTGATGTWSGYVVKGGANNEVAATFTVPTADCQSTPYGFTGFWVGIQSTDGNGIRTIVQDGIQISCGNGQPSYSAWGIGNAYSGGTPVFLTDPVQPVDRITAVVWESGATYWMSLYDPVENWWWSNSATGGAASSNTAAIAAESFFGGADFDPVAVTGAEVNGLPLNQFKPEADEQDPNSYHATAGLDPSGLDASGENFNFYWNGQPGEASSGELIEGRLLG